MTRINLQLAYFEWLYSLVFRDNDPESELSYTNVCEQLHEIPFRDMIPNDDNRKVEGIRLRDEFISQYRATRMDRSQLCSMTDDEASLFEMLVALSRRANFIVNVGLEIWFREFLGNLGLLEYSDARYHPRYIPRITRALRKFNDRRYNAAGKGGIFPLKMPNRDQRQVEIWYQMAAYMTENEMY